MANFHIPDSFFITSTDCPFILRRATMEDCPRFDEIFEQCRQFMASYGNTKQWTGNFPNSSLLHKDISLGNTIACVSKDRNEVVGVFSLCEHEEAYDQKSTVWQYEEPYVVIHRLGTATGVKVGRFLIEHVMQHYNYIRLDTHKDNKPLIHLMQKLNFKYAGYVNYVRNNGESERIAFDWHK